MDFPIKEEIKASLVRLWFAGLVCYLVLWGSSVSCLLYTSPSPRDV